MLGVWGERWSGRAASTASTFPKHGEAHSSQGVALKSNGWACWAVKQKQVKDGSKISPRLSREMALIPDPRQPKLPLTSRSKHCGSLTSSLGPTSRKTIIHCYSLCVCSCRVNTTAKTSFCPTFLFFWKPFTINWLKNLFFEVESNGTTWHSNADKTCSVTY